MGQDAPTTNNKPQPPVIINILPTSVILHTLTWWIWLQHNTTCPTRENVVVHKILVYRASWGPHGKPGWSIGPAMDHYRQHRIYSTKKRTESIADTVGFLPKEFNMPKMSSTDADIHAAQDFICGLQNPAPASPLVTVGDTLTSALKKLVGIFNNTNPRDRTTILVPTESQWQNQPTSLLHIIGIMRLQLS